MQDNEDPDYNPLDDLAEAADSSRSGSGYPHTSSARAYHNSGGEMTNGMAVTSMIMGILSIPSCFCYGIPSIIFAVLGLVFANIATKQMASGGYASSSRGMNTAGKICSFIGLALGLAFILLLCAGFIIGSSNPNAGNSTYPY